MGKEWKNSKLLADTAEEVKEVADGLNMAKLDNDQLFAIASKLISIGRQLSFYSGHALDVEPKHVLLVKDAAMIEALKQVLREYDNAVKKFPNWPDNKVIAAAIVCEESGELMQAANNYLWNDKNKELFPIHQEAVQTAAVSLRMILGLAAEIKAGG